MASRVLVVGPAWVGDMVMAQSLYKLLKSRQDGVKIDVVAPGWSRGVIERMPEVSETFQLSVAHGELGLRKRRTLGHALRDQNYDQAIVLPRSAKASLVPWFAGIPQRTGYRGEFRYGLINDCRRLPESLRTVDKFCWLANEASDANLPDPPQPRLRVDSNNQARLRADLRLETSKPAVAIMPGAEYGPAKQWPIDRFAGLVQRLVDEGFQVWVLGSGKEQELGSTIAAGGENVYNLCGQTELVDAIDLLAMADGAVSNDSGLMHVAAAVGTPLVALYGSSSPELTPPLSEAATILWRDLDCSPCFKRHCPLDHLNCLKGIGIEEVAAALASGIAH